MADYQSHNTTADSSVKKWLLPGWGQTGVYLLVSFFLLLLFNANALWTYYNGSLGISAETASAVAQEPLQRFSDFTDGMFRGRLAPMLFWAFLGVFTYMIIWFLQNAFTNVRNDITAEGYKHPWNYQKQNYWYSVAADKLFFVCTVMVMALFIFLCMDLLIPMLAKTFYAGVVSWHLGPSLLRFSIAIVGTSLLMYVFLLILMLVRNSWRWVTSNL